MTIPAICPNGHKLAVDDSQAAQQLPCPTCGATVTVPQKSSPELQTSTVYWLIGGGVGGAVAAVLLVVFALRMTNGGGLPTAPESAVSGSRATFPADGTSDNPATATAGSPPSDTGDLPEVTEKLSRIGIAFHYFHDTYRVFSRPRAQDFDVVRLNAQPQRTGLSWRVHLLPFLDQKPLYARFHLDESWDSPHNKTLIEHMPDVFRVGSGSEPTTRFQVITGPNMLFGGQRPSKLADVSDGARHTILVVVTGPERAVPWTQPDTLKLDPDQPVASLGAMPDRLIKCVMGDAKPLILPDSIAPSTFLALATPKGNEIVDADKLRRDFENRKRTAAKAPAGVTVGEESSSAPQASPATSRSTATTPSDLLRAKNDRMKKLKELVLAMQNYQDVYQQFPIRDEPRSFDSDGKPFLSWRVHLLPFLEQETLYKQFALDEPWDSPHNRSLIPHMPEVFRDPSGQADSGQTRFMVFTGRDTPFPNQRGLRFRDFRDGLGRTILIVSTSADTTVDWTKPEDIVFDADTPLHGLVDPNDPAIYFAKADGAVVALASDVVSPEVFKAMVTPAGGETTP